MHHKIKIEFLLVSQTTSAIERWKLSSIAINLNKIQLYKPLIIFVLQNGCDLDLENNRRWKKN